MDPATMEMLAKGGIVVICLYVIYLGTEREKRAATAFEKLNDRSHEMHTKIVENLADLSATNRALHADIRTRPCVADENWNGTDKRHGAER